MGGVEIISFSHFMTQNIYKTAQNLRHEKFNQKSHLGPKIDPYGKIWIISPWVQKWPQTSAFLIYGFWIEEKKRSLI